jgi:Ca2+/Na+ antiporter
VDLLFSLVLVAGVRAATRPGAQLWAAASLGLLALGTRWAVYATPEVMGLMLVSNLAFFGFTAVAVFSAVSRQSEISVNTISGGICVYLLIAVIWAILFQFVELLEPGSFRLPGGETDLSLRDLLYFSMVTMTTLGYGDITPISSAARSLASGEAVVGQLFVAIFIARLVGLYTAQQHRSTNSNS